MKHLLSHILLMIVVFAALPALSAEQTSANFVAKYDCVSNGSGKATSASYKLNGTARIMDADVGYGAQYKNKGGVWVLPASPHTLLSGDIDHDGQVSVADALFALRIEAGLVAPAPAEKNAADVGPLVNGTPHPDGKVDIGDVVVILRRAVGLVTW